ncbi:MAG: universal stress protein [Acidobacteriaceae bacterium]|jgi:nucleotide-binding universal stress UspA family protein
MFRRIVVAYDGSPESQRSLVSAIRLAKSLDAELHTVTVIADLPAYTAFADAADSSVPRMLELDRRQFYQNLQEKARDLFASYGIGFQGHLIEGKPVEAIVDFLRRQKADLLVLGLHQRELHIARLWSTVYELAQDAPCSVLGVH